MLLQIYPVKTYDPCELSKIDWAQSLQQALNEWMLKAFENGQFKIMSAENLFKLKINFILSNWSWNRLGA